MEKYTVLHTGYPVAGRPIQPNEWSVKSKHASERAAWRAIERSSAHLSQGSWDDHYRVIAPDGTECDRQLWFVKMHMENGDRQLALAHKEQ